MNRKKRARTNVALRNSGVAITLRTAIVDFVVESNIPKAFEFESVFRFRFSLVPMTRVLLSEPRFAM